MTDTSKLQVSTIHYGDDEITVGIFATREALLDDLIERFAHLGDDEYPLTHENVERFIELADIETVDVAEYDNPHAAEPDLLAAIFVPPYIDEEEGNTPAGLACPHCASPEVVEIDIAVRWNRLDSDIEEPNLLAFNTDGDYQFDSDGLICTACQHRLAWPDAVNAEVNAERIAVSYS